jgi:hypothetical protein
MAISHAVPANSHSVIRGLERLARRTYECIGKAFTNAYAAVAARWLVVARCVAPDDVRLGGRKKKFPAESITRVESRG